MGRQYLFGYGSLINAASRAETVGVERAGLAIPVVVKGLRRSWSVPYKPAPTHNWPFTMTALGAVFHEDENTNGILVQVSDCDLDLFDGRERDYKRCQLELGCIEFLGHREIKRDAVVHAYLWNAPLPACEEFPIVQSYVDVVMSGCFQLMSGHKGLGDFASDFVSGTTGWDGYWIDDRKQPRYERAMSELPLISEIDGLLARILGKDLNARKALPPSA
jgi:hypothetical protein